VVESDISVAGRMLASFPSFLTEEQRVPDNLAELGKLTLRPKPTSSSCPTSAPRWAS
jgi:isocitrate dehydrogenase